LVTSITTIGGLMPLILVTSSEVSYRSSQNLWSNLALATIGGLSAATVLTLTVIPVLYLLAERARGGGRRLGAQMVQIWRSLPD
jgi:multidrug efflux pump subunit AcrB